MPFWHPLSTLFMTDPRCLASATLLRMTLAAGGQKLIYAGDSMWPAVTHGATVDVERLGDRPPARGEVLVACPGGIPDLLRVVALDGDDVVLRADAVPGSSVRVAVASVVARTTLGVGNPSSPARSMRRLRLDLAEALREGPDTAADPARTVLDKYDAQAPFYAGTEGPEIEAGLLKQVRQTLPAGGRVLVVGSGVGHESFALARAGWDVTGIDFSPAMVRLANERAAGEDLAVRFESADVRRFDLQPGSLAGVLFTYDVYSFIPCARDRTAVLTRLREALAPGGRILLSARRVSSAYGAAILTLQHLARGAAGEWGDSHTRWIAQDGELHRSYVRVFTGGRLRAETAAAGLVMGPWTGGHCVVRPAIIGTRSAT